jgi:hypothetical protein
MPCLTDLEKKVINVYRRGFEVRLKRKGGKVLLTLWMVDRDLRLADLYGIMEKIWAYQRAGLDLAFDLNDLHFFPN